MASPGKLIGSLYIGKSIDIFMSAFGGQVVEYSQMSIENKYILHGKVVAYHEDCDIIEMENHKGKRFFVHGDNIDVFWEAGTLNITESIGCMIPVVDNKKIVE